LKHLVYTHSKIDGIKPVRKKLSFISRLFINLTKKDALQCSREAQQQAFGKLKEALPSTPILTAPNFS
jgi:hypothetical protein